MTDIAKILDHLYLGSLFATHPATIEKHNIRHIISLGAKPCKNQESALFFDVSDNVHEVNKMKAEILPISYSFIDAAIQRGENVLVHCQAGKSRSATVVIYYLMRRYSISFENAHHHVATIRPEIGLNKGFFDMLACLGGEK